MYVPNLAKRKPGKRYWKDRTEIRRYLGFSCCPENPLNSDKKGGAFDGSTMAEEGCMLPLRIEELPEFVWPCFCTWLPKSQWPWFCTETVGTHFCAEQVIHSRSERIQSFFVRIRSFAWTHSKQIKKQKVRPIKHFYTFNQLSIGYTFNFDMVPPIKITIKP